GQRGLCTRRPTLRNVIAREVPCARYAGTGGHPFEGEYAMRKNHRLLAAAGSLLAAGAIALSGIVAAAAAPHAARSGASGIERFQAMSTSDTSTKTTV